MTKNEELIFYVHAVKVQPLVADDSLYQYDVYLPREYHCGHAHLGR